MSDKSISIDRRKLLAGIGAAGALGMAPTLQAQPGLKVVERTLDLDDPKENLRALLKLQADLI